MGVSSGKKVMSDLRVDIYCRPWQTFIHWVFHSCTSKVLYVVPAISQYQGYVECAGKEVVVNASFGAKYSGCVRTYRGSLTTSAMGVDALRAPFPNMRMVPRSSNICFICSAGVLLRALPSFTTCVDDYRPRRKIWRKSKRVHFRMEGGDQRHLQFS